jgi:hypothetical protein
VKKYLFGLATLLLLSGCGEESSGGGSSTPDEPTTSSSTSGGSSGETGTSTSSGGSSGDPVDENPVDTPTDIPAECVDSPVPTFVFDENDNPINCPETE